MLLTALLASAPVIAQEATGPRPQAGASEGMPADVMEAQAFILSAYPDLVGRPLAMTARRDGGAVLVSVVDEAAPAGEGQPRTPLLTARVQYDAAVRLVRYDAYGPLVHEDQNLALQDQLLVNPRWIDSDADAWLMSQGVQSTVGTSFLASRDAVAATEKRLGATRAAAPARFRWHQEGTESARTPPFRSRPAWTTQAVTTGEGGVAIVYEFEYEPFGGRLIAVTQQEAR